MGKGNNAGSAVNAGNAGLEGSRFGPGPKSPTRFIPACVRSQIALNRRLPGTAQSVAGLSAITESMTVADGGAGKNNTLDDFREPPAQAVFWRHPRCEESAQGVCATRRSGSPPGVSDGSGPRSTKCSIFREREGGVVVVQGKTKSFDD
jgi:hypothetical protein